MNFAIIASEKDLAGVNIKNSLLTSYDFRKTGESFSGKEVYAHNNITLYTVEGESIFSENIDEQIRADFFIFATKHKSAAEKHSLSVHIPGNWGKADFGGENGKLCIAPASLVKQMFLELNKNRVEGYEVTLECTHHGPFLGKKPVMFIEIGSNKNMWQNKEAGEAIAKTIMNVLASKIETFETVLALGSTHYPSPFNKVLLRTELAIGHICPKHMLHLLDKNLLEHAIERTQEKVSFVLLDWKGLGQHKNKVKDLLEELNLPYKRVQHTYPSSVKLSVSSNKTASPKSL